MDNKHVVLVTGMSGAGKTTAMSVLEDMGYHCIDNFPVTLINELGKVLHSSEDERYQNLALATTAQDYLKFLQFFANEDVLVHILYLDASDEKLLLRYKFTRRNHPMMINHKAKTLEEAIEMERDLFAGIDNQAIMHIDTSKLDSSSLKKIIKEKLSLDQKRVFSISFSSFGFKHGVPLDADIVFDARFLPNPFYIEGLKELTGDDLEVYEYVMSFDESKTYAMHLTNCLDFVFDEYQKQNKPHICVAIGCTGGHHRSVTFANYLYEYYKNKYTCFKSHRDIKVG